MTCIYIALFRLKYDLFKFEIMKFGIMLRSFYSARQMFSALYSLVLYLFLLPSLPEQIKPKAIRWVRTR